MTHPEQQYLDLLARIIAEGDERMDRTGTGTIALFGQQMRFDLTQGFPAVTTKKLAWKALVSELLWFIEGSGDEKRLKEILHGSRDSEKQTIWTGNANADYWTPKAKFEGDLGRVYGVQWRSWQAPDKEIGVHAGEPAYTVKQVDQLAQLIEGLKKDPFGRRHVLTAWNPGELDKMALPPCHMFAQFFVSKMSIQDRIDWLVIHEPGFQYAPSLIPMVPADDLHASFDEIGAPRHKLSCQMYQRSADMFLGVPFNIASYSLFTHMIAQVCNFGVGEFVHILGDTHVYSNHVEQVKEQISRTPLALPTLWLNPEIKDIDKFTMDDIRLEGYQHLPPIKADMAV
jgi:thymidylate synthase